MPTYNPKDMAYVLQMSKTSGRYTPEELALMQDINRSVAGGAMTGMPTQTAPMPMPQTMQQNPMGAAIPMNRLAQIQAAANQVLAGGQNPEGQNMANIARYFQGTK